MKCHFRKSRAADLKKFFWPQGIAIVGASADPAKPGGRMIQLLQGTITPGGSIRSIPAGGRSKGCPPAAISPL